MSKYIYNINTKTLLSFWYRLAFRVGFLELVYGTIVRSLFTRFSFIQAVPDQILEKKYITVNLNRTVSLSKFSLFNNRMEAICFTDLMKKKMLMTPSIRLSNWSKEQIKKCGNKLTYQITVQISHYQFLNVIEDGNSK